MAFPKVYINGQLAGEWDYGYNSFHLDITKHLNVGGKNILAVHANTDDHDSRWYPGGGIYRKVQMLITNPVHAAIWGTYITTPIIKSNYADVRISTSLLNHSIYSSEVKVEQIIFNHQGKEIAKDSISNTIPAGKNKDLEVTIKVNDPQRWDIDNPVLYKAVTNIYNGGQLVDSETSIFGIRTIRFTADDGFYLNDKRVQLKGVNLHHDHGPLGAAFNQEPWNVN